MREQLPLPGMRLILRREHIRDAIDRLEVEDRIFDERRRAAVDVHPDLRVGGPAGVREQARRDPHDRAVAGVQRGDVGGIRAAPVGEEFGEDGQRAESRARVCGQRAEKGRVDGLDGFVDEPCGEDREEDLANGKLGICLPK